MKKTLVIGTLMAFTGIASGQWTPVGSDLYKTNPLGNTGIGTTAPAYKLDVSTTASGGDGIRISNNGTQGEATLRMDNNTSGGHKYGVFAFGAGDPEPGAFGIYDYSLPMYLLYFKSNGNCGIGLSTPQYKTELKTSSFNDGLGITQTGTSAGALHIANTASGGKHWALFSTGSANTQGAGHFSIYDYAAGSDRLFIDGSSGNVGINRIAPINARLDVKQDLNAYTFNRAIYGDAVSTTGATYWNGGVEGVAGTGGCSNSENYGVRGRGLGGNLGNYGGYFHAENYGCNTGGAYGIYADAVAGGGTAYAAFLPGTVYAYSYTSPSDKKLKENIKPLSNTMDKIKALKPSTYNYKKNDFKDMNLPDGSQMGLIAQELEEVFPGLITPVSEIILKNEKGEIIKQTPEHKSVNYIGLIPVLISGIQEQQSLIENLQQEIARLKQTNQSTNTTGINQFQNIETGFSLSQNEPNPFNNETLIKYTLTPQTKTAVLNVYDLSGKQITSFPLNDKGASSITITSEKLAAGIYIYSVVADGKVIDSKRMIVAEK